MTDHPKTLHESKAIELLRKVLATHDRRGDLVAVMNEIDGFLSAPPVKP